MPVLVFDFDSTLVQDEGLDELFLHSLEGAADREERASAFRAVTDRGMDGALPYAESLRLRMEVLRANEEHVAETARRLASRITPSVERHRAFFQDPRFQIHIVSGGFQELILPTASWLGIPPERVHAQRFQLSDGAIVGIDPHTPMARGGKLEAVRLLQVPPGDLWIVGDGATDLEIRTEGYAGTFVAFTENRRREPVVSAADHVAASMDDLLHFISGA
jgi:D-3-phosphoglycerate dehydrogenase